jgi:hypothetical protein
VLVTGAVEGARMAVQCRKVDSMMTLLIEGLLWAAGQIMQVAQSNGTSKMGIESIQES